jgi:diacylglycerol kinase (ATP)
LEGDSRILLVHNPRSRLGPQAGAEVRAFLDRTGLRAPWVSLEELSSMTEGPLPERAIAVGGDGTVASVAEWIVRRAGGLDAGLPRLPSPPPVLGIVPSGTGNNLAKELGIPGNFREAMEIAAGGVIDRRIDAVSYAPIGPAARPGGARILVQSAQLGFPADVTVRFHSLRSRRIFRLLTAPLGRLVYEALALEELAKRRLREWIGRGDGRLRMRAVLPGRSIEEDVLAVFLGNGARLGGGFLPCPLAEPEDGILDLCFIRAEIRDSSIGLFRDVMKGKHLRRTGSVEYIRTPGPIEIRLERTAPLIADGDIRVSAAGYRFEVIPGAVRVAVGPGRCGRAAPPPSRPLT